MPLISIQIPAFIKLDLPRDYVEAYPEGPVRLGEERAPKGVLCVQWNNLEVKFFTEEASVCFDLNAIRAFFVEPRRIMNWEMITLSVEFELGGLLVLYSNRENEEDFRFFVGDLSTRGAPLGL